MRHQLLCNIYYFNLNYHIEICYMKYVIDITNDVIIRFNIADCYMVTYTDFVFIYSLSLHRKNLVTIITLIHTIFLIQHFSKVLRLSTPQIMQSNFTLIFSVLNQYDTFKMSRFSLIKYILKCNTSIDLNYLIKTARKSYK